MRSGIASSRIGTRLPPADELAAGTTVDNSARNCASDLPDASRPMTVTVRIHGRVLGSSVGTSGNQNCDRTSYLNPGGITPITVYFESLNLTVRPRIDGSLPNQVAQSS